MYQDIETLKGPEEIFQELDNDDAMENQDERGQKSPTDGVMGQGMPLEMPPGVINEADRIMLDDKGNALNVKTE